ncbi:hypothetical protein GCM10027447_36500 [Glycomyces halotolerans]
MPPEFQIDPDEVRTAAGEMAEVAEALSAQIDTVAGEASRLEGAVDTAEFVGIGAVAGLTSEWTGLRLPGHRETVDEIAGFLAEHTDGMVEADESTAGTFDEHRL